MPRTLHAFAALVLAFFAFVGTAHAQAPAPSGPVLSADMSFEDWQKMPDRVRYTPGSPIPVYYEHKRMIKKAAVITGISVFGGVYLASTLIGVVDTSLYPMLIPLAGPWITIATSASEFGWSPPAVWWLTVDGLAQATGLGLLVWGMTDKTDWLVKKPYGFASNLYVVPHLSPSFAGGTIGGRF